MIRVVAAVAAVTSAFSFPAAGQTPKLSAQQLNPPKLIVNKPAEAPKPYSPNLTHAPVAKSPTIAVQRPFSEKTPRSIVSQGPSGSAGAQLNMINVQEVVSKKQQAVQETTSILHKMNNGNCIQCLHNIK